MAHVLSFFKNSWTKRAFSLGSAGYAAFLLWLAWLTFTHYLIPTNPQSLFALYLFINVIFGCLMIYTRKQVMTQIVACVLHPCIMVALVFAFGNWYLLIPPFVAATVVFFASGSSETIKTVLGTLYLIIFVLEILAYLTLQLFTIKVFDLDMNLRSPDYLYSPDESYRLVKYIDDEEKENRKVVYYVEPAFDDLELPFLKAEMFYGGIKMLTSPLAAGTEVKWIDNDRLLIDGVIKHISQSVETGTSAAAKTTDEETILLTTAPDVTKAPGTN